MKQGHLWDSRNVAPLASHRDDPDTSRRAAIRAAPRAGSHGALVLALVRERPRRTSSQIADALDFTPFSPSEHTRLYQVRRRLSDLRRLGVVESIDVGGDETVWQARGET